MRLLRHQCDLMDFSCCCSSSDDEDGETDEEEERVLPQSFRCVFIFISGRLLLSSTSGSEGSGMFAETDELPHRHSLSSSSSSSSQAPPAAHCGKTSLPSFLPASAHHIGIQPTTECMRARTLLQVDSKQEVCWWSGCTLRHG